MGTLLRILLLGVGIVVAFVLAVIIASESGEVVVLQTFDPVGTGYETRLWVIEDGDRLWLRAGDPESRWLQRLRVKPEVELERGGETRSYQAVPVDDPDVRTWLNASLAEKYGWADRFVSILGDHSVCVPTRLDPREG
jgi:hypothetical protein